MWSWPINTSKRLSLLAFYNKLFRHFGAQGWWPITPGNARDPVYIRGKSAKRLTERERFEICLGAFLTQNTSWVNVSKVLSLLKKNRLLSFETLSASSLVKMRRHFRSSGYFRQKAKRVRRFLHHVQHESAGNLKDFFRGSVSKVREKLLSLHGVGPETADSMLLYAAGKPVFVVDAYTKRVGVRWGVLAGGENYDQIQKRFESELPRSAKIFGEYHALIVKLAKDFCRVKPMCFECPLNRICKTGRRKEKYQ